MSEVRSPVDIVRTWLVEAELEVVRVDERDFPGERFVVVSVLPDDVRRATEVVYDVDVAGAFPNDNVLVTVRSAEPDEIELASKAPVSGVNDPRVDEMIRLITSHSRSSLSRPSLEYIQDGQANLSRVMASRHCLVFGRRGAGKTSLLLEAQKQLTDQGAVSVWFNMQPYRSYSVGALVSAFAKVLLERLSKELAAFGAQNGGIATSISALLERLGPLSESRDSDAPAWLPVEVNSRLKEFSNATGKKVVAFIDDFYLLPREVQPFVLDGFHSCTRDAETWLKVASVKHLTRTWDATSQSGFESQHDVELVELDVTLQEPELATDFLRTLLDSYAARAGIGSLHSVFARKSLDRLVLASGAVPRDYLVLASRAITESRRRHNARVVGVEDVNRAAGRASAEKRKELEEDLAAQSNDAALTLHALSAVREFCLDRPDSEPWTYFRVSFRAKESRQEEYGLLTRLLEVRMLHMLDSSISDPKRAGVRFEVYMLDLSEYTGQRFRRGVNVLNFEGGTLTAQTTGLPKSRREGTRARDVTGIFRRAPELDLALLSG